MDYYNVGTIINTQGLQGEVRVFPVTDFPEERFKKGAQLALFDRQDQFVDQLEVRAARSQKNYYIVKFAGLTDINQVEKYKNFTLKVAKEHLSALTEGEFYYHDIIGLDVRADGELIGRVAEILQPGANDVWVVKRAGRKDLLLPYINSVMLNINLVENFVEVAIPDGLED
jgi:16S rRNA processing protein RimM